MTHLLADLGWVDLDLGCSTVLLGQHRSCSTDQRPVEHPKSKSAQHSPRPDGSPCIYNAFLPSHDVVGSVRRGRVGGGLLQLLLGQSEVADLDRLAVPTQEDVPRLQVAVDDPL